MESMISEDFKQIPGFINYYVNKKGDIYSFKKNKWHKMILKEDKDGYLEVGLYRNKKRYFRRVHRLVLTTWVGNPNKYLQVNHKDGNVKNNNIDNLEWCTCRENLLHSFRVLHRKPSITTNKKILLTDRISKEEKHFNSIKECAYFLGMSYEHLGKLLNGVLDITKSKKLKSYNIEYEV